MSSKMVDLHTLKPNERNPRKITSEALKTMESAHILIRRHGKGTP